jgi:hypothetical protein
VGVALRDRGHAREGVSPPLAAARGGASRATGYRLWRHYERRAPRLGRRRRPALSAGTPGMQRCHEQVMVPLTDGPVPALPALPVKVPPARFADGRAVSCSVDVEV